jgi:peptidase MA superfamily protein/tetratricopeptide repeat protein
MIAGSAGARARARAWTVLAALLAAGSAAADTIVLTNGRVIQADRAWFEGSQVRYEKNGGVFGLPRSLVQRLEQTSSPTASYVDPDVAKAQERLAARDAVGATRLLRTVLGRDPNSLPALQLLAEAYLNLGDGHSARQTAERALHLEPRDARSRALLGDAFVALGDRTAAEDEYRRSLLLKPDREVQRKLEELAPAPVNPQQGARFRLSYDGGVNEPMGQAVLDALTRTYEEYTRRFGFRPEEPVTVVLQTEAHFQDAETPEWAAGLNDGTIRVPVRGLDHATPGLLRVLRHELAHSFIAARTGGNCPTWLQEGVSQYLEGGEPSREDSNLGALSRQGRVLPLLSLEAPFQTLAPGDVSLAYAESLSAVAHIARKRGEAGIVRLLLALSDGLPSEEALPVALALSYPEFQRSWEEYLKTLR